MLHGVTMLQVDATPTIGFPKSASPNPTVRSIERLGARSGPSTTMEECGRGKAVGALIREAAVHHGGTGRASGVFMVA
jgi:hypothetical protein